MAAWDWYRRSMKKGFPGNRLLKKLTAGEASFRDVFDLGQRRLENLFFTSRIETERRDFRNVTDQIKRAIDLSLPFAVVRPGDAETRIVRHFLRKRLRAVYFSFSNQKGYGEELFQIGNVNVGIVPTDDQAYDLFSLTYLNSLARADLLVYFGWTSMLCSLGLVSHIPKARYSDFSPLRSLGSDSEEFGWISHLRGRKVLIVSPFRLSILSQFRNKAQIPIVNKILPDFALDVMVPPVTFADEGGGKIWEFELRSAIEDLRSRDFDVVVIGAGSYGPPLAIAAKEMGKVAIHLGGDVQGLFGIYGNRLLSSFPTLGELPGWVRPLDEEVPRGADLVEGGAYW